MNRSLVIQLARLGDLAQTFPLLQSLRKEGGKVVLLCEKKAASGLENFLPVDEVISVDFQKIAGFFHKSNLWENYISVSEELSALSREKYDTVYNLNHSPLNMGILSLIPRKKTLGFLPGSKPDSVYASPAFRILFNQSHNRRFARVHLADMFKMLSENPSPPEFPLWNPSPSAMEKAAQAVLLLKHKGCKHIIAVHPSAGAEIRKWGAEKFARTFSLIRDRLPVGAILLGTDREENSSFLNCLQNSDYVLDLTAKTTIDELSALVKIADITIGTDTGPLQIASAVGGKTLGLYFVSALVFETGPLGEGGLILQTMPVCAPCDEGNPACPDIHCREMITPEIVSSIAVWKLTGLGDIQDFNLLLPENVLLFESKVDKWGQKYELRAGHRLDNGDFYRELWMKLRYENGADNLDSVLSRYGDIPTLEKEIARLGTNPEWIPLAHHYFLTRADEGALSAAREFARAQIILENLGITL